MFNDTAKLYKEINNLKKEIEALKDEQIKQRRDNNDAMYNLDSDNLPSLQGIVKKVNLAITEGGKVTAKFIMDVVNGESNAKIEADRIDLEGKEISLIAKGSGESTAKFLIDAINNESVAQIKADRIELEGSEFKANLSESITLSVQNELDSWDVGGRNWLFNSGFTNVAQQYFKAGNEANIDSIDDGQWWVQPDESYVTIVEHEGSTCARIIGKKDQTCWLSQNIYHLFAVNSLEQQYTFSADIKLDITSKGNNHYIMLEAGPWRKDGTQMPTFKHRLEDYAGKGWIRVSFTFSLADIPLADWGVTDASQISISKLLKYVNFCVYARDFEGNLYFKNLQLEKGNIATEWTPAPEDMVEQGRIITAINLTKDSAKISAEKLDIEGKQLNIKVDAANITGTLTVKEADGDVLFSAGKDDSGDGVVKIGSWNVDNNSLWTGTSFSAPDSIFLSTGSNGDLPIAGSPAQANWVIKAGQKFGVNKEGKLYASEAHIFGELTAGSGSKIGYWNIDAELGFYTDTAQEEEIYYVRDLDLSEHKIAVQQIKFALNHKGIQTIYTATYKGIASSDIDDTLFVTPTAFEKATGFTFKGVVNASYAGLSLTQKYEISWISLGACIVERIKSED